VIVSVGFEVTSSND